MKKSIALLLSLLVLFNSFGFVFTYFQIKSIIKRNITQNIRRGEYSDIHLELLVLSIKSFKDSLCDPEEIKFDGKMYDIVDYKIIDDKVHIRAIHDKHEDIIDAVFNSNFESKNDETTPLKNLVKILIMEGLTPNNLPAFADSPVFNLVQTRETTFHQNSPNVILPPPKNC